VTVKQVKLSLVHKVAPPNSAARGPHPTLVLLHGRGADENDLFGLTPYFDPRFQVISVRAPFPFPFGGHTWYEMLNVGTPEPKQFTESYDLLTRFIDDIGEQYPVDSDRLFLLGFSMGTVMSYAYSLTKPERIRGVIAHSGYIPEDSSLVFDWKRIAGKRFFVAHGIHDPVIEVGYARRARTLLSGASADLLYKEYAIPHSMSEESIQDISSWLQQDLQPGQG